MKTKTFSIHFNGSSVQVDVFSGSTIKCGEFVISTPKLTLGLIDSEEAEYSDVEIPFDVLEAWSKIFNQLVENIKSDQYINDKRPESN